MIFVRSRRPHAMLAAGAARLALLCAAAAWICVRAHSDFAWVAGAAALFSAAVAAASIRAAHLPAVERIGLFRDRLVVNDGARELHARWSDVVLVTLALGAPGAAGAAVRLGDQLTLATRAGKIERRLTIRPRDFGIDAVWCRDTILRLRDSESARARLPEFDSILDLRRRPTAADRILSNR